MNCRGLALNATVLYSQVTQQCEESGREGCRPSNGAEWFHGNVTVVERPQCSRGSEQAGEQRCLARSQMDLRGTLGLSLNLSGLLLHHL